MVFVIIILRKTHSYNAHRLVNIVKLLKKKNIYRRTPIIFVIHVIPTILNYNSHGRKFYPTGKQFSEFSKFRGSFELLSNEDIKKIRECHFA